MVQHPGEYPWSSYAANALGRADSLLTPHVLYLALDKLPERRQAAYRALFQVHIDNKTLEDIRQATQQRLGAWE